MITYRARRSTTYTRSTYLLCCALLAATHPLLPFFSLPLILPLLAPRVASVVDVFLPCSLAPSPSLTIVVHDDVGRESRIRLELLDYLLNFVHLLGLFVAADAGMGKERTVNSS